MNQVKVVSYAYPTSIAAINYRYSNVGCWIVEVKGDCRYPVRAYPGPDGRNDAFAYAESIPHPYCPFSSHKPQ